MKFLLHTCCATCAGYVIKKLQEGGFDVTAFFCNSNIQPEYEYIRRLEDMRKYCLANNIDFIQDEYNVNEWLKEIKGLEKESEGGKRCEKCFAIRLEKTAQFAKNNNFDFFATTLTISPHKNANMINKLGEDLAEKNNIQFYTADWKKQDGFKCACEIAKKEGFYKQNYCGCLFSK